MSSSSELLLAIGPALFGAQWKRGLSRALNVNERTVNRWVAADPVEPRADIWPGLLAIMKERREQLSRVIDAVEAHVRDAGEQ
jgi:hypothetical protein